MIRMHLSKSIYINNFLFLENYCIFSENVYNINVSSTLVKQMRTSKAVYLGQPDKMLTKIVQ